VLRRVEGPAKDLSELVDYCAIYLLIAGTYTPFALLALPADIGLPLLAAVWGLSIAGMGVEIAGRLRRRRLLALSVPLYLGIGWLGPLVAGEQLLAALSPNAFSLLLAGGLVYTGGVVFFLWRSLPYNHAVWHALVLIASAIHFGAVIAIVLPAGAAPL
jgi:hemolysin III